MRHGIAADRDDTGPRSDDRARPLTPKGIKRMNKAAKGLATLSLTFDRILTSRIERARQTAKDSGADSSVGKPCRRNRAALARTISPGPAPRAGPLLGSKRNSLGRS